MLEGNWYDISRKCCIFPDLTKPSVASYMVLSHHHYPTCGELILKDSLCLVEMGYSVRMPIVFHHGETLGVNSSIIENSQTIQEQSSMCTNCNRPLSQYQRDVSKYEGHAKKKEFCLAKHDRPINSQYSLHFFFFLRFFFKYWKYVC